MDHMKELGPIQVLKELAYVSVDVWWGDRCRAKTRVREVVRHSPEV